MSDNDGKLTPNRGSKRVLIVSYYWPPSGGGGVQRWLKFAKLLPECGWTPIVVTPSNPDLPVHDDSLVDEAQGIQTWTFPIWEPSRAVKHLGNGGRLGAESTRRESLLSRCIKWVRGNVFVPDARVTWVRPTVKSLKRALKEQPVDLVVTTGPPHSMHLIGLALKQELQLPWVVDMRDPWSDMDYLDSFQMSNRVRRRIQAMEREVVSMADRVITTSRGALTTLEGVRAGKTPGAVLTNGWDRDDFQGLTPADKPSGGIRRLGHFGALYGARSASALWQELATQADEWTLVLGGPVTPEVQQDMSRCGLQPELLGSLPHRESVQLMVGCDALLVLHNDSDSAKRSTPGKMFECLATPLPVLVVGPKDSDIETLCAEWGFVFVAHHATNAAQTMASFLENPPEVDTSKRAAIAAAYERRVLTRDLAGIMDDCVRQAGQS